MNRVTRLLESSAVRYLIIGGVSFVLDLGLLTVCYRYLHWALWLATGVGFWGSFFCNYLLQHRFSFGSRASTVGSLVRYSVLLGFNTLATMAIVELAQHVGWGYVAGKLIAAAATTVWNYFVYREWVFAQRPAPELALSAHPAD